MKVVICYSRFKKLQDIKKQYQPKANRQRIEVVIYFTRLENGDFSYNVKKSLLLEKN